MKPIRILVLAAAGAAALAGIALADGHTSPEAIVEARQQHMKAQGAALGVLGDMAKGKTPYDAAKASTAADALVTLAAVDPATLWIEGTDTSVKDSRALPALFEKLDDVNKLSADLLAASQAMQAVAGTDLASLQAAVGPVGEACGACHKPYRQPK